MGLPDHQFDSLWDDDHYPGLPYQGGPLPGEGGPLDKPHGSGIVNIQANCSYEVCLSAWNWVFLHVL